MNLWFYDLNLEVWKTDQDLRTLPESKVSAGVRCPSGGHSMYRPVTQDNLPTIPQFINMAVYI